MSAKIGQRQSHRSNNTSGHIGVSWQADRDKWRASICTDYKQHILGEYADIDDAVKARELAVTRSSTGTSPAEQGAI